MLYKNRNVFSRNLDDFEIYRIEIVILKFFNRFFYFKFSNI